MKKKKLLSIVLSFRNEEDNIEEFLKRTKFALSKLENWEYEFIFVNDCSSDNSEKIIKNNLENFNIKLINMSRCFGNIPCVLAGFRYAEGDALIYIDIDMQDPPELFSDMVKQFEAGYEVVHTKREKRMQENYFKQVLTKFAYLIINYFSYLNLPVEQGNFKLLSKRAYKEIVEQNEKSPYLRGVSFWIGFKSTVVEYIRSGRYKGRAKFNLLNSTGPYKELIRGIVSYSYTPLYFGYFFSIFCFFISIIIFILSFNKILILNFSIGILTSIILLLFSFLFFCIGFIGSYIERIYEQNNGRKNYIVSEVIKSKFYEK